MAAPGRLNLEHAAPPPRLVIGQPPRRGWDAALTVEGGMTTDQYATHLAGLDAEALYAECVVQAKANVGRSVHTWRSRECLMECHQPRRLPDGPALWRRAVDEAYADRRETERGNAERLRARGGGE
jgi:hypothetical protein